MKNTKIYANLIKKHKKIEIYEKKYCKFDFVHIVVVCLSFFVFCYSWLICYGGMFFVLFFVCWCNATHNLNAS